MNPASFPPPSQSPPFTPPRTHPARSFLRGLLIAGGYFLLARASFAFADLQPNTTSVWPPTGIAMAVLFLCGRRYAPAVFLGAVLTNLDTLRASAATASPLALIRCSLGTALGNTAEALLAAWTLEHRAGGRHFCDSALGASRFVTNVALLPPLLSAGAGGASLALTGLLTRGAGPTVFVTWYVGNVTGLLIFGAAAVLPWRETLRDLAPERWREGAALLFALLIVGNTMTGIYLGPLPADWPREYMILPVIVWATLRFHALGTVATLLLVSLLSIGGTALPGRSLLNLQIFLAIVAGMAWLVCGAVNELRRLNARLADLVTERVVAERRLLREHEEGLALAAHDVRVPLVGIRNLLSLFLRHHVAPDDAPARQLLGQAADAASQALAVAARHLAPETVARLRSEPEPTDWVPLVAGVAARLRLGDTPHPVEIRFETALERLPGVVDRARALEVLENLTANAVRFSPPDGVVTLGLAADGPAVVLTVSDQGPGVTKSALPTLFRSVGFAGGHRRAPGSGSGLGSISWASWCANLAASSPASRALERAQRSRCACRWRLGTLPRPA